MKRLLLIISLFSFNSLSAQITIKECIDSGLANKANIKSAQTELLLANLKTLESKGKYLPQISFAYDYRYNAIIPSQIVPVGQFNPVPTSETRSIQFGTKWQQNVGVTVYQPLLDFAIKSRIKESKLNESLSNIDLHKAEHDLKFEIARTYSRLLSYGAQLDQAISDTLRSFQNLSTIKARFNEGKVLKTELNNAIINHHNNISNYKTSLSTSIKEKIYLHYLTNIPLERVLEEKLTEFPDGSFTTATDITQINLDSVVDYQRFGQQKLLIDQQIRTEKNKLTPTVGLQGFLGANQFSQTFAPMQSNSWFGNSYVGLSVKLPILSNDRSINASRQLQTQRKITSHKQEDWKSERLKDLMQINEDIKRLKEELSMAQANQAMMEENVKLYRDRLDNGQVAANELNQQEAELQKIIAKTREMREQLNSAKTELYFKVGNF